MKRRHLYVPYAFQKGSLGGLGAMDVWTSGILDGDKIKEIQRAIAKARGPEWQAEEIIPLAFHPMEDGDKG